jgi:hypothetical protein
MGYNLECKAYDDGKRVVIEITSEEKFGVREMIKVLAHFMKQQIESNNITFESCKIEPGDKTTVLQCSK